MRAEKEFTDPIKKGSIVQVDPKAELGFLAAGGLAIVVAKHAWGVDVNIIVGTHGTRALTWQHIEPTGGTLVWEEDGTRLVPEQQRKHHP